VNENTLKKIISLVLIIILFIFIFRVVSWLAYTLLPIAVLICAGYIVYKLVKKG